MESLSKELELARKVEKKDGKMKGRGRILFLSLIGVLYTVSLWAALFIAVPEMRGWANSEIIAQERARRPGGGGMESEERTALSGERKIERDINRMLEEAKKKQKKIEEREKALAKREFRLKVFQRTLMRKAVDKEDGDVLDLENEQELYGYEGTERRAKVREENLETLIKNYQSMRSENAASALAELFKKNRGAAVKIITGMSIQKSSKIWDALAGENPALAAEISEELIK